MATGFIAGETTGWTNPAMGRWHRLALFAAAGALLVVLITPTSPQTAISGETAALWFWHVAAVGALLGLACRLPLQNAVAASIQTALVAWTAGWVCARWLHMKPLTGGTMLPGGVSSGHLAIWVALAPSIRATVRLLLAPRRGTRHYGFEVLGISALLAGVTGIAIETASRTTTDPLAPLAGIGLQTLLVWSATGSLIHVINTPWVLGKRPAREPGIGADLALLALIGTFLVRALMHSGATGAATATGLTTMLFLLGAARRRMANLA